MDIGTIAGLASGFVLVLGAILLGGNLTAFISVQSIVIVLGGTLATGFIMFPLGQLKGAVQVAANAFRLKSTTPQQLIDRLVSLSEIVRREGLLALEDEELEHDFLKRGINLAIDGTDPEVIDAMLQTQISFVRIRHQEGQKIFKCFGEVAPAFGMIGTLIGLVQMLQSLNDPASIGPAMATALLTTLYGSILANLVFIPISRKLENRTQSETLAMAIISSGIRSVTNGDYPRLTRERLESYLSGAERGKEEEQSGEAGEGEGENAAAG
jgi:chemotaxis protein MotA